jgi:hypothetical protein
VLTVPAAVLPLYLALGEIGAWRIAVAVALFVIVLLAHRRLFGVSPL